METIMRGALFVYTTTCAALFLVSSACAPAPSNSASTSFDHQLMSSTPTPVADSIDAKNWDTHPALDREVSPQNFDQEAAAIAIFFATNEARARHRLPALAPRTPLFHAARSHAVRMTEREFFAHEDPTSKRHRTPDDRARRAGVINPHTAENIAMGTTIDYQSGRPVYARGEPGEFSYTPEGPLIRKHTYVTLAQDLLKGWMNSPGHRRNILATDAIELGCGAEFFWQGNFPAVNAVQNFQLFEPLVTAQATDGHEVINAGL